MALDPARFLRPYPDRVFSYDERDTILYALCAGMGRDPLDRRELEFVCGSRPKVIPSQATVIAWDYGFILGSGIDEALVLHGAQSVTVHRPLPPAATVISSFAVTALYDKGPGRGAIIVAETKIRDKSCDALLCTNVWTSYARGEGGFGGERGARLDASPLPSRRPDAVLDTPTLPNQPLFYRLLGDVNPLHCDPRFAARAGFDRPIMHGLNTYGIACRAVVTTLCGHDPTRIRDFRCRFTAPVLPGETIRTEMWRDGDGVAFRCLVQERKLEIISDGSAVVS